MNAAKTAVLALTVWAGALGATSLIELDEASMTARADHIVRGTVLSSESAVRSGPIPVFTNVSLQIDETLKGSSSSDVLQVALPGGELDGKLYQVSGTPTFTPGDQVLVFLTRLSSGELTLLGFSQGRYQLEVSGAGTFIARRSTLGATLVRPTGPGQAQALRAGGVEQEPWEMLRSRLLQRVADGGR